MSSMGYYNSIYIYIYISHINSLGSCVGAIKLKPESKVFKLIICKYRGTSNMTYVYIHLLNFVKYY